MACTFAALKHHFCMKDWFSILVRTLFTFVAFSVIQFQIPPHFLVIGGLLGGFFALKTTDDRPLGLGVLIGTVLFAIYAFVVLPYTKSLGM
jgi:hypothetical protein